MPGGAPKLASKGIWPRHSRLGGHWKMWLWLKMTDGAHFIRKIWTPLIGYWFIALDYLQFPQR